MKYYLRFLWIAFFCGAICILGFAVKNDGFFASDVICLFGMDEIGYFTQYLPQITYWFFPLLFFQAFFGSYIYRHFCTASIYFFSRYTKRTRWLFKEILRLFLFCCLYLFVMLISGLVVCSLVSKVKIDASIWKMFCYYMVIYSLYLFVVTLGINLLSIVFNSNIGFIVVEGINLFFIAAFAIAGNLFAPEGVILEQYEWIIKINPFYYLIFSMRNSNNDYLISMLLFMGIAALLLWCSFFVVNKHNFIESNQETGGM